MKKDNRIPASFITPDVLMHVIHEGIPHAHSLSMGITPQWCMSRANWLKAGISPAAFAGLSGDHLQASIANSKLKLAHQLWEKAHGIIKSAA